MRNKNKLGLIVAFYISKYDDIAYKNLGYGTITLTHKEVGKRLGIKGSTIQNMRDEFDPHHDNSRKGWWQRGLTPSRRVIKDKFENYSEPELRALVMQILNTGELSEDLLLELDKNEQKNLQNLRNDPWSDSELEIVVNSYLYMLRLQIADIPFTNYEMTKTLLGGPLRNRNRADLRKRMRHISDVLRSMGMPILGGYTPVSQFAIQTRKKIESLLAERIDEILQMKEQKNINAPTLQEVLGKLQVLEEKLEKFETPKIEGLGHNNPPEPIEDDYFGFRDAKESIRRIREELVSTAPNRKKIEKNKSVVLKLGLKLVTWTGDRITDFSKATAIAAGTGVGVWATGLGPQIIDTMKSLADLLVSLG